MMYFLNNNWQFIVSIILSCVIIAKINKLLTIKKHKQNKKMSLDEAILNIHSNKITFDDLPEHFKYDKIVILSALKFNHSIYSTLSYGLRCDKDIVFAYINSLVNELDIKIEKIEKEHRNRNINDSLERAADKMSIWVLIKSFEEELKTIPAKLLADEYFIMSIISYIKNTHILEVFLALKKQGTAFEYASNKLKYYKELLLETVKQNFWAVEYVPDNLKNDKEFVLEAVKSNGYALKYASDNLKNDKEFVLEAVKQDGRALEYVPDNLKNDEEFVLEAVKSNGNALKYASANLKNDKEFVLEAVKQNGYALKYASDDLKNDKEFVLDAAKYHSVALQGASDNLKTDKEFLLKALQLDYNKVSFIVMPRYEDGVPYGKVGEWYKEVGDTVKSGELLFSIYNDKTLYEFESSQNGVLYIVQEEGSEVPVDTIIALLKIEDLDENQ